MDAAKPIFDPTISLGAVLQIFVFLISAFAVYNRLDVRLAKLEQKVEMMYSWWAQQVGID